MSLNAIFLPLLFSSFAAGSIEPIVVTATKNGTARSELPFSVGKVSADEWQSRGEQVENSLSHVPGLSFSSGGGEGQTRSVFLRGARAEDTLVLVDGIPLNDPLSPSRSFDFSQIPSSSIESIEITKGPQSVIYGSDALGGVIQFFTKPDSSRASLEVGSYKTLKATASHLGFHGGFQQTSGISAADSRNGNIEPDGHRSWNLGGKRDFLLNPRTTLRVQGLYHDAKTDTDRQGGPGGDSLGTFTKNAQLLFKAEALRVSLENYEWLTGLTLLHRDRSDNTLGPAFYRASRWKLETSVKKKFGSHLPTAGAEFSQEAGRSSEINNRKKFSAGGFFAQNQFNAGPWQAVAGGRVDFHQEQGRATTVRGGLGYWAIPEILRARASIGTGFKAPSLYQTYSIYGSRNLQPSRILSLDGGLELGSSGLMAELTYFRSHFRNLIDFDSARSRYFNIGRARTSGLEIALSAESGRWLSRASYTILSSRDLSTGLKLARRPSGSGAFELSYRAGTKWGSSLFARFVGQRDDIDPILYTRQRMPSFATFGAHAHYQLRGGWKLTARGENLLNRRYQETSGFGTPGLSGYGGLEVEL